MIVALRILKTTALDKGALATVALLNAYIGGAWIAIVTLSRVYTATGHLAIHTVTGVVANIVSARVIIKTIGIAFTTPTRKIRRIDARVVVQCACVFATRTTMTVRITLTAVGNRRENAVITLASVLSACVVIVTLAVVLAAVSFHCVRAVMQEGIAHVVGTGIVIVAVVVVCAAVGDR